MLGYVDLAGSVRDHPLALSRLMVKSGTDASAVAAWMTASGPGSRQAAAYSHSAGASTAVSSRWARDPSRPMPGWRLADALHALGRAYASPAEPGTGALLMVAR